MPHYRDDKMTSSKCLPGSLFGNARSGIAEMMATVPVHMKPSHQFPTHKGLPGSILKGNQKTKIPRKVTIYY